ncbi:hypothetical protein [Paenibacillus campinasensis]|nr:hypothetical protein [Paenibacillus campinasensis]
MAGAVQPVRDEREPDYFQAGCSSLITSSPQTAAFARLDGHGRWLSH